MVHIVSRSRSYSAQVSKAPPCAVVSSTSSDAYDLCVIPHHDLIGRLSPEFHLSAKMRDCFEDENDPHSKVWEESKFILN